MSQTIFPYRGYEMRSYSETVWAGIMDALRVRWIYEAQVIETRHGWYLPDFYLPACGMFVEVKGPFPSKAEIDRAQDAERSTGCPVVFAHDAWRTKGDGQFNGELVYFAGTGAATLTCLEITRLVNKHLGMHDYARILRARMLEHFDGTRPAGDLLREMLNGWMDRGQLERSKQEMHAPLNAEVLCCHASSSRAEWVVPQFVERVHANRMEKAA